MRQMPTFGRDRIRRFWHDVATRKKLAARDYEAFLIVSEHVLSACIGTSFGRINFCVVVDYHASFRGLTPSA